MPRRISAFAPRVMAQVLAAAAASVAAGACSPEPGAGEAAKPPAAARAAPLPTLQVAASNVATPALPVRVCLTPEPVERLALAIQGGCRIRAVDGGGVLDRPARLGSVTAAATASGVRIGTREYPVSQIEVVPDAPPDLRVGDRWYRGSLRLFRRPGGKLIAVNVLPLEEYVASVVDSEMPAAFPAAARQAQAIAARTYALYQMTTPPAHPQFDLHADVRSQKYLGYQYLDGQGRKLAGETADGRRVAEETAGIVCTHRGKVFCTYYSAVCGGRTVRGDLVFADAAPPLVPVACDWCRAAERYRWSNGLSGAEIAASLGDVLGGSARPLTALRATGGVAEDGSAEFVASDGVRTERVSATMLRRRLPAGVLHSPHFTVRKEGDRFVFDGRGHGHGVGLCQWGAKGQAEAGRNCLEILRHYYPGAEIVALRGE
ncbi:MAG: SpoIID/LytB domain-containing protein [Planctomycetales bacterium]